MNPETNAVPYGSYLGQGFGSFGSFGASGVWRPYGASTLAWLQSYGATSDNLRIAWEEVLTAEGYWDGTLNGSIRAWLETQCGTTGLSLTTLKYYCITRGLVTFVPVVQLIDPIDSALVSGRVQSIVPRVGTVTYTQGTAGERPLQSSNGKYLILDNSNNEHIPTLSNVPELNYGTNDFTILFPCNLISSGGRRLAFGNVGFATASADGTCVGFNVNLPQWQLRQEASAQNIDGVTNLSGAWTSMCYERISGAGNTRILYYNGGSVNIDATGTDARNFDGTGSPFNSIGSSIFTGSAISPFDGLLGPIVVFLGKLSDIERTQSMQQLYNWVQAS